MKESILYEVPFVNSVVHPTDFSEASRQAFAHALAIALIRQTRFTILHVGKKEKLWTEFPPVRQTLEQWGFLDPGSAQREVFERLRLRVEKKLVPGRPLKAILDQLQRYPTDLIVLATKGREGFPRWLRVSLAESIQSRGKTMTLFVSRGGRSMVSPETGQIHLKRILIPFDEHPNPLPALEYAARLAQMSGQQIDILLLHAGTGALSFACDPPKSEGANWRKVIRSGEPVKEIIHTAQEFHVDLIIMATAGKQGILDALRGNTTQQVLRQAPCPLLAVPSH
jgi:nucleotide-binding universal stress UspA family protein